MPSPNYDERSLSVNLLVLHYTGMSSGAAALARMCDVSSKVSAHYMVEEDGKIIQLVDERKRAWHAGVSNWAGETNINSASIGVEIVNGGHDHGLPGFPKSQITAVVMLCKNIIKRRHFDPFNIVAHSDIAPARKQDPGEKFPWEYLARKGIGYWPKLQKPAENQVLFESGDRDRGISIVQSGLAYIGYGLAVTGVLDQPTRFVIEAFQRRYRPSQIDGNIDVQTLELLTEITNFKKSGSVTNIS